jgi:hypothetical protein
MNELPMRPEVLDFVLGSNRYGLCEPEGFKVPFRLDTA